MKKDILFLCQYFYPENNSSAMLPFDTAEYLAGKGYSVGALCGYPREYSDEKSVPKTEVVNRVKIQRLNYLHLRRSRRIGRLINYLSFTVCAMFRINKLKNYKTVIVYSNPPILPLVAVLANILFGTKIIFVSYDVYPDIAIAMGSLADSAVVTKVMNRINKMLFKRVALVVALTNEMREYLLEHRTELSTDRIVVIPNWAHEENGCRNNAGNKYEASISDCFVVTYLGNMGICQEMNTLIAAAEALKDCSKVRFVLAGHGLKAQEIKEYVEEKNLHNITVDGFLTGSRLEKTIGCSSCFVVSLEAGLKGMCAPSKYYSYLYGGRPIISITDKDSYIASEIVSEHIGAAVRIGDSETMARTIMNMVNSKEENSIMGACALRLYNSKYCKQKGLEKYHSAIRTVVGI